MNKSFASIYVSFVVMLSPSISWPQTNPPEAIPPILNVQEIQNAISAFNQDGLRIYPDTQDKGAEFVQSFDPKSGNFYIRGLGGSSYRIYKADINNDGDDEYVLVGQGGSGQFFDIEAIYKRKDGKFQDIYDQIKLSLRKLLRSEEKASYDLEEGYVGMMHGDILIEKENGKVYFSLVEASGQWWASFSNPGDDTRREEHHPAAHKYLWDKGTVRHIKTHRIFFKKQLDPEAQVRVDFDPLWRKQLLGEGDKKPLTPEEQKLYEKYHSEASRDAERWLDQKKE